MIGLKPNLVGIIMQTVKSGHNKVADVGFELA